MDEMRRIDILMSHYKPESELSQINQRGAKEAVKVDKVLFDLIKLSRCISRRSPTTRLTSRTRASATSTTTGSYCEAYRGSHREGAARRELPRTSF